MSFPITSFNSSQYMPSQTELCSGAHSALNSLHDGIGQGLAFTVTAALAVEKFFRFGAVPLATSVYYTFDSGANAIQAAAKIYFGEAQRAAGVAAWAARYPRVVHGANRVHETAARFTVWQLPFNYASVFVGTLKKTASLIQNYKLSTLIIGGSYAGLNYGTENYCEAQNNSSSIGDSFLNRMKSLHKRPLALMEEKLHNEKYIELAAKIKESCNPGPVGSKICTEGVVATSGLGFTLLNEGYNFFSPDAVYKLAPYDVKISYHVDNNCKVYRHLQDCLDAQRSVCAHPYSKLALKNTRAVSEIKTN